MKKILVIQNKRIGDVLIASIIANNVKKVLPDCHITYFVYDYTAGVLKNNPNIDRVVTVKDAELKKIRNLFSEISKIRREKYDVIFDPYAKFQSRLMCLLSGAKITAGFKRKGKKLKLPFYTHPVNFLDVPSKPCGKALEDRINLTTTVVPLQNPEYKYKIFLSEKERQYAKILQLSQPIVMIGILGSVPKKSLPQEYVVKLIDFVTSNYNVTVLFNYAPNQKEDAAAIYSQCTNKDQIAFDIYEPSIRGFIKLLDKCTLLIANEGGSVHIAKALDKPTFTIYSPYIRKGDWDSFENLPIHKSIHLKEEKPELFDDFDRKERKTVEKNPENLYQQLTPNMVIAKLKPFLDTQLKKQPHEPA